MWDTNSDVCLSAIGAVVSNSLRKEVSASERLWAVAPILFSSIRRHTRFDCDWSSDVCSSDLGGTPVCMARLAVSHLEGMQSGKRQELAVLVGRGVVAAAGIADPDSFAEQLGAAGASVQLVAYQDHHAYRQADLERLVRAAAGGDYVVVTEKDAVKLRRQWPGSAAEPLVAVLAVQWERNGRALEQAVDAVLASARRP